MEYNMKHNINNMNITVYTDATNMVGGYTYATNTMGINSKCVRTLGTLMGVVAHEYGHAVHNAYGYTVGGNSIVDENMANYVAREIITELYMSHRIDNTVYTRAMYMVSNIDSNYYNTDTSYTEVVYMHNIVTACRNGAINNDVLNHVYDIYAAYAKALNIGNISKESNREIQIQTLNAESNNTAQKTNSTGRMAMSPITLTSQLLEAIAGKSVATITHRNPVDNKEEIVTVVKLGEEQYAYMTAKNIAGREWAINMGAVTSVEAVQQCEDLLCEFEDPSEIDNADFIANLGMSGMKTFAKLAKAYTNMLIAKRGATAIYCTGADERRQKAYRYLTKFGYEEDTIDGIKTWVYYAV
jgi:hypothetical protein